MDKIMVMARKTLSFGIVFSIFLIVFVSGCVLPPEPVKDKEGSQIVRAVGDTESTFLIQKINPDSVEGLWFQAYPIQREEGTPRTLKIGDDIGYACEGVSEVLASIDYEGQTVTFEKTVKDDPGTCPICLSGETLIDTPDGEFNIKELKPGMRVWTTDLAGNMQAAVIFRTGRTRVPDGHMMVNIILDDGREISGSGGHPTADQRIFSDLKAGDTLDGAIVKNVGLERYDEDYTYDILVSGETSNYFADGILVGSTLR